MDFYQDIKQFSILSSEYRVAIQQLEVDESNRLRNEILDIINFNSKRLQNYFKLHISKQTTKLSKKDGIPLISLSINKILAKGNSLTKKDLATLNPKEIKKLDGVNMLLDHSGSMWFTDKKM